MWAWLRSPRGSTATATAVAAVLALAWLAPWSKPMPRLPGLPAAFFPGRPAGDAPPTPVAAPLDHPAPSAAAKNGVAPASAPAPRQASAIAPAPAADALSAVQGDAAGSRDTPPPPGGVKPAPAAPSFDVVRVENSGSAVVAGRGEPGSTVRLLDNGQVIAQASVDAGGQFALLPPDLSAGSHYLTLQSGPAGEAAMVSRQGVAVAVGKPGTTKPLVAMLTPDGPAKVLSDGAPIGAPAGTAGQGPVAVAIQAVEAAPGGRFTASGVARAGSQSRLYLNGAFLADVTADKDGRWAVKVEKGMRPGKYVVRADELEAGSGKVAHRAEVPFTYPAAMARGSGKQLLMARATQTEPAPPVPSSAPRGGTPRPVTGGAPPAGGPASGTRLASAAPGGTGSDKDPSAGPLATIVSDVRTATVSHGDSLWRISRKMLGRGVDYTAIYASNAAQIRNPDLIYPGQIFVVPHQPEK